MPIAREIETCEITIVRIFWQVWPHRLATSAVATELPIQNSAFTASLGAEADAAWSGRRSGQGQARRVRSPGRAAGWRRAPCVYREPVWSKYWSEGFLPTHTISSGNNVPQKRRGRHAARRPELGNRPFFRQRDPFCEDLRIRQGHDNKFSWWSKSGTGTLRSRSPVEIKFFLRSICCSVPGRLAVLYRRRHSSLHAIESRSRSNGGLVPGGRLSRALSHAGTSAIGTTVRCGREHR